VARILDGLRSALVTIAMMAAFLLVPPAVVAGLGPAWPPALGLLAGLSGVIFAGRMAMALWRPQSLEARRQAAVPGERRKQPLVDAVGLVLYFAYIAAWFAFIPLDVARLHVLPEPPAWASAAGLAAALAGAAVGQLAVWQNAFATPAIQDQSDRGQYVVDRGLYGAVRHPLYAGNLLLFAGSALWLGSLAALLATAVMLVATLARIVIEERYLMQSLPGYADYRRRVRARLIPFVL
jgi:protein-S-isoprenylcysteine O-methyltransferase Ste14